jgi:hypothetical protein
MSRPIPVALIGLGGVGRAILSQLLSPALAPKFNLVLIANSRQSLSLPLPGSQITPANYLPVLEKYGTPLDVASIISVLSAHPDGNAVLIDSTGSDAIPALYPQILKLGIHVITPNKKAASGKDELWKAVAEASYPNSPALYYGESTVGAGLPLLSTLKDLVGTGDEIIKIEGVFSGTLSYIFNEYSKVEGGDVKFSEVVKIAKDKGYTVRMNLQRFGDSAQTLTDDTRNLTRETTFPVPTSRESSPFSPDSSPPLRPCQRATPPSPPSPSSPTSSPTPRAKRNTSSDSPRGTSILPRSVRRPGRRARLSDTSVRSTSSTERSSASLASECRFSGEVERYIDLKVRL